MKFFTILLLLFSVTLLQSNARVIRAVGWIDEPITLYANTVNGYQAVEVSKNQRSLPVDVGGTEYLEFFTAIPVEEAPQQALLSVNLKGKADELLLILIPTGSGQWKALTRDDSLHSFPVRSAAVINATNYLIGGRIADQRLALQPGDEMQIDLRTWKKRAIPIQLGKVEVGEDFSRPYFQNVERFRSHYRMLFIFTNQRADAEISNLWKVVDSPEYDRVNLNLESMTFTQPPHDKSPAAAR